MKKEVHPKYFEKAKVTCACGSSFEVGATKEKVAVEICSKCHPFYTGKQQLIDAAGRVERFKARRAKAAPDKVVKKKTKKVVRAKKVEPEKKTKKKK
jgi:large subunit ribosomal protein L31